MDERNIICAFMCVGMTVCFIAKQKCLTLQLRIMSMLIFFHFHFIQAVYLRSIKVIEISSQLQLAATLNLGAKGGGGSCLITH